MSDIIGSYAFLPWLRQGVARTITSLDGDASVVRATTHVELTLTGQGLDNPPSPSQIARDVELYGPGEVIGIESRAIVRTDPRPWITNVEPNYLPHIEFYEEDFPWRYTPAAADASHLRLRPWIALVVLKDTGDPATAEFREAKAVADRPLPFISVKDFTAFPPHGELWAWAHVHVNRHLGGTADELVATDVPAAVARLESALAADPDIAYSRIVCPRRLEENCAYHAFLVPTFERGRLAGLGMDPNLAPFATASAWVEYGGRPEPLNMPYYYRWYFRTGGAGDFESLVRLLKWKTADPRVGRRDMDVQAPGSNIPGILDPDLHGILRLGGALRAPLITLSSSGFAEYNKYENWAKVSWPHPFQQKLARFINLADNFTRIAADQARIDAGMPPTEPDDVDPLITSPIYGEWQALQHRLLTDPAGASLNPNDNWIHELNLDPRHRVAGGFGGDVVRKHQEEYMEAAWKQVGEVLEHNRKARVAQTLLGVIDAIHVKSLSPLAVQPSRLLALTAPLQMRVLDGGTTVRYARQQSLTPPVLTSPTMRRISRPKGPLSRRLDLPAGPHANAMLEAVNDGIITAAPPKQTPGGITTVEAVAEASADARTWPPAWLIDLARGRPWLRWVLALLALLLIVLAFVLPGLAILFVVGAIAAAGAAGVLEFARRQPTVSEALGEQLDTVAAIDQLGPASDFVFGENAPGDGGAGGLFTRDNIAAARFKSALKDWAKFAEAAEAAGREPVRTKLDLRRTAANIVDAVLPARTIPKRFLSSAAIAPHIRAQIVELFDQIKYYPRIDEPMYRPLKDLGDELFVPNLNLIERDSVVALETYQDFIEAYMVGVNHEFSRELLWREYPTDMRGSYFRQFWDVTAHFDPAATDAEVQREKLYDIPPSHTWPRASKLGEHDNRQPNPGEERNEIVLAIRGELLKKYPNTVIYAHAAAWTKNNAGQDDPSLERKIVDLTGGEVDRPPRDKVRTPLYEAKVDPDIYFFGFDLDAEEARGKSEPTEGGGGAGWFFVLKERPGEPRFGLDIAREAGESIVTVNDLTWSDAAVLPGKHLNATSLASLFLQAPTLAHDNMEKKPQYDDDVRVVPAAISAARWAYLLYQAPVMVAVHAAELLKTAPD